MENKVYDAAIVGMGPAGIACAIYLKRSNLKIICFEKDKVGGALNKINEIENYPSFVGTGEELAKKFDEQLKHFEIDIIHQGVSSINPNDDGTFLIRTIGDTYSVKSVIVCSGIKQRPFVVPNSIAYHENGISRCAECDGPFSKNKPVAVYSSTSSGAKEAIYLASLCSKVYFINPEEKIEGDQTIVEELSKLPNVEILNGTKIKSTTGTRKIETITLSNEQTFQVNALFLFIGATPITEFLGYMDVTDKFGQIKTNEKMETSVKGLFACGDSRITPLRQVVSACSDGAIAAVSVRNYLNGKK